MRRRPRRVGFRAVAMRSSFGPAASRPTRRRARLIAMSSAPPGAVRIASPSGLTVQLNANASLRRIDCRDVIVNAFLGNELEGGPANLFLRRRADRIAWTPLLGPRS